MMRARTKKTIAFVLGFAAGGVAVILSPLWPAPQRSYTQQVYEQWVEPSVTVLSPERIRTVRSRYGALIRENARRFNVDPDLVLAVMLTESAGRPDVRSHAGAIGLMQVMPATGRELAAELGIRLSSDATLADPGINVTLGTYYLAKMMAPSRRLGFDPLGDYGGSGGGGFDYQLELVLSAYNAGPGNTRRWVRERSALAPGDVVQRAGFDETRKYVTRVKRYLAILQTL